MIVIVILVITIEESGESIGQGIYPDLGKIQSLA